MKIVCPCCKGKGEIEETAPVHLSPLQLKIYKTVRKSAYGIPGTELVNRIYADRDDGGPLWASVSINVQILRMNKRLAAVGQRIGCGNGKLYRLTNVV
jgi:hypothetical protein